MSYKIPRWEVEISHAGLGKHEIVRDRDRYVAERKAQAKLAKWEEMWLKKQLAENNRQLKEANLQHAEELTRENLKILEELDLILAHTLDINDAIDWDSMLDTRSFELKEPVKPAPAFRKNLPNDKDPCYNPKLNVLEKLIPTFGRSKIQSHKEWYQRDMKDALKTNQHAEEVDKEKLAEYNLQLEDYRSQKEDFEQKVTEYNDKILAKKEAYLNRDLTQIEDYCDLVLSNSEYPDYCPKTWNLSFDPDNGSLIIDYDLPDPGTLPTNREVKYIATRNVLQIKQISATETKRLYDSVVMQIGLRTVHELFEADVIDAISMITFNGYVDSVDKSTGLNNRSCILTFQATKAEFLAFNLAAVVPKECIKRLKGVFASKLHSLTPVAPILRIDKTDSRFQDSYDVSHTLDEGTNLAAMDWQDFEHLVREIFSKEFSTNGGEVKVTQASRDGGVDAIAFDPDPIRGGKIVIQAKRYTNTVGVSAVRDLYGTVMNEGATKGILISTSSYGPDAHEFAKGKPITLLSGGNLVHLLEKHGHKAYINLKEAKSLLASQDR